MEDKFRCPKCGAGSSAVSHTDDCPDARPEDLLFWARAWRKQCGELQRRRESVVAYADARVSKAKKEAALWHGKYVIVKAENNVLRKKK
jgi:hypothetical protein